jgi:hypothetical protein
MLELIRVDQQRLLTVLLLDFGLGGECRKIKHIVRAGVSSGLEEETHGHRRDSLQFKGAENAFDLKVSSGPRSISCTYLRLPGLQRHDEREHQLILTLQNRVLTNRNDTRVARGGELETYVGERKCYTKVEEALVAK